MRVTVTGASGLIGSALVPALLARGAEVTVLTRDPQRLQGGCRAERGDFGTVAQRSPSGSERFTGAQTAEAVQVLRWDPPRTPVPADALAGRDAVVHLAGENIAQRWRESAKARIRESRVLVTRQLVDALREVRAQDSGPRPQVLLSASAVGYYGNRYDEPLDEDAPGGRDFLAQVCAAWEAEAAAAAEPGLRVVRLRTGVVLDARGGALAKMLPPFRLGVGGPVAGGRQYISWIHLDDLVGIMLAAIGDQRWSGPVNATAPQPVRNSELSRALGKALRRPSLLPVPGVALRLLYGEMASLITNGARVLPAKALVLGYRFQHQEVAEALHAALGARAQGRQGCTSKTR